jgi:hypothetical protein
MLDPPFWALVTTRTFRPLATVASDVGSASAVARSTLSVDDSFSGFFTPNVT